MERDRLYFLGALGVLDERGVRQHDELPLSARAPMTNELRSGWNEDVIVRADSCLRDFDQWEMFRSELRGDLNNGLLEPAHFRLPYSHNTRAAS